MINLVYSIQSNEISHSWATQLKKNSQFNSTRFMNGVENASVESMNYVELNWQSFSELMR